VESITFQGARRVSQETLQAAISTKPGDAYDLEALDRDLSTLWNTRRFDDIRWQREAGQTGWIIRFTVVERPVSKAAAVPPSPSRESEVLDRFKMR
jgi:outer membrane protein assembly factor BamA